MNMKVVITWGIVIAVFALVGIFGMVNQDLLVEVDNNPIIPIDDSDEGSTIKVCNSALDNGNITYKFNISGNDKVEKITVTYNATASDIDAYAAASSLSTAEIPGVKSRISGSTSDFVLITTVNMEELDATVVEQYQNDLSKLALVLYKVQDYNTYTQTINAMTGKTFSCD